MPGPSAVPNSATPQPESKPAAAPEPISTRQEFPADFTLPKLPGLSGSEALATNRPVPYFQKANADTKLSAIGAVVESGTSIDIATDGVIQSTSRDGKQISGQIKPDGTFKLSTGQTGSVFRDDGVRLDEVGRESPLQRAFSQAGQRGSIVPHLRKNLTQTGAGVAIVGIDGDPEHLKSLSSIAVGHPDYSIAPGATWVNEVIPPGQIGMSTTAAGLQKFVEGRAGTIQGLTDKLNEISKLKETNPEAYAPLRVVNMSTGNSVQDITTQIHSLLGDEVYGPKLGAWNKAIFGEEKMPADRAQAFAKIEAFVAQSLGKSETFGKAHDSYIAATKRATEAGLVLTVSAGNRAPDSPFVSPGAAYNFAAMSPHVVTVAASNTNQTPANFADDFVRSSPSQTEFRGQKYTPTISAPGEYVQTAEPLPGQPGSRGVFVRNGSSIAAPIAAGTFALMFEANPKLTPAEAIKIVRDSAVDTKLDAKIEGAGMLDPVSAVKRASGKK